MNPAVTTVNLTANGSFVYPALVGWTRALLEVSGNLGGGSVAIGYDDGANNFVAYRDAAGAAITTGVAAGWLVDLPLSARPAIVVSGSTAASIKVSFKRN